jgi:DNA-directed RNA polymerase specialized sigma24 family protein
MSKYQVNTKDQQYQTFELLYDAYAPKAFGFIISRTNNKQMAEEYLTSVFLKVWQEIKTIDEQTEKKFLKILLLICKPIYRK